MSKVKCKYVINIICKAWKQVIFEIEINISITKLIELLKFDVFLLKYAYILVA
jgi:hypothetical protein